MELPGYNQLKQCRQGWMIYNKHDTYLGKSLEVYGEFSEGEVDAFRTLIPAGAIVVEVGANIGAHTMAFANIVGPQGAVIAYEPQRLLFLTLCGNVALNSHYHVYCHRQAVSDAPGEMNVPVADPNVDFSFGGFNIESYGNDGDPTPVVTLDMLEIGRCAFVKIDVEGMEAKVIAGAHQFIAKHRPTLYVENDRTEGRDELIADIAALDYELYWHVVPLYRPNNCAGVAENIFEGAASFNMICVPREKEFVIHGLNRIETTASA